MLPSIQIITDCIIYICILNCLTIISNFKLFVIKFILGNIFFYLFFIRILLFKILNKFSLKHTIVKTLYIYYLKK